MNPNSASSFRFGESRRRIRAGRVCLVTAGFLVLLPGSALAVDVAGPRAVVDQAVAQVLEVLGNAALERPERTRRIEGIAYSHFDFTTMSKLVLARSWRRFSAEQQENFIVEFKHLLSRRYGTRLDRYSDEGVEVTGERPESRGDVSVLTEVTSGGFEGATINYRMRKRGDTWKAIDVVIEGVSLVSSYRTQFRDLLGDESPA
ncbi:MAG: ABC transporter substrate-binding protein, partial [Myxococcota bacterium]